MATKKFDTLAAQMLNADPVKQDEFDRRTHQLGNRKPEPGHFVPLEELGKQIGRYAIDTDFAAAGINAKGYLGESGSIYMVHSTGVVDKLKIGEGTLSVERDLGDRSNTPRQRENIPSSAMPNGLEETLQYSDISQHDVCEASLLAQRLSRVLARAPTSRTGTDRCDIRICVKNGDDMVAGVMRMEDRIPTVSSNRHPAMQSALGALSAKAKKFLRRDTQEPEAPSMGM